MSKSIDTADQDEAWVKLAVSGSLSGLQALYTKYFQAIYRFCFWQTTSAADAEDLTQEVFVAMAKSLPGFKGEASFKNWLYQIAKNIVARWINQKTKHSQVPLLDTLAASPAWIDPENDRHKQKVVKKLLNLLSPQQKQVLSYRFLRNFSVLETAHKLKISSSYVKVTSYRAIKKLQKQFVKPPKV